MKNKQLAAALMESDGILAEAAGLFRESGISPLLTEAVRRLSDSVDMLRELAEG